MASVAQLAASIHRLVKSSVKSMHLFQLLPPDVTPSLSPVSTPANFVWPNLTEARTVHLDPPDFHESSCFHGDCCSKS